MSIQINKDGTNLRFGCVRLKRMTLDDIEIVRSWRNSERIRRASVQKSEVNKEQQLKWFKSLDRDLDYYYLICLECKPVGVVSLKGVDGVAAQPGVFIGDDSVDGQGYGFVSVFMLNYFAFNILRLNKLEARILDDNKSAIRFNRSFGYVLEKSEGGIGTYRLDKDVFKSKYEYLRGMALRVA